MMKRLGLGLCGAAAAAWLSAGPLLAQEAAAPATPPAAAAPAAPAPEADKPKINITVGGEAKITDRQVLADTEALNAAFKAIGERGFAGLNRQVPALQKVLDHAPADYPKVAIDGGSVIVRMNPGQGLSEMMMAGLIASATQKQSVTLEHTLNVYPMAAFVLGSWAVENKRYEEAIAYLDRGLALQPNSPMLLSEKAVAYQGMKRPADALAVYEKGLAGTDLMDMPSKLDRARLLRGRGYSLGELGRYDEAIAAYEESLKEEPGNRIATGEIGYLRGLKAGKAPGEGQIVAPNMPAS